MKEITPKINFNEILQTNLSNHNTNQTNYNTRSPSTEKRGGSINFNKKSRNKPASGKQVLNNNTGLKRSRW